MAEDEEDEDKGPKESVYRPMLMQGSTQFRDVWQTNTADTHNIHQKHDVDIIKDAKV